MTDDAIAETVKNMMAESMNKEVFDLLAERLRLCQDPEAMIGPLVSGALAGVVRMCFAHMGDPLTARHCISVLTPMLHGFAEQVAKKLPDAMKAPEAGEPGKERMQ